MVFVVFYWLLPRSRAALTFSEAEIAFLFPAPIKRRTLIHYRWINTQLRILFTSLCSRCCPRAGASCWAMRQCARRLVADPLDARSARRRLVVRDHAAARPRHHLAAAPAAHRDRRVAAAAVVTPGAGCARRTRRARGAGALGLPRVAAVDRRAVVAVAARELGGAAAARHDLPRSCGARARAADLCAALRVGAARRGFVRGGVDRESREARRAAERGARRHRGSADGAQGAARAVRVGAARRPELAFLWKNLLSSASTCGPRPSSRAIVVVVCGGRAPMSSLSALVARRARRRGLHAGLRAADRAPRLAPRPAERRHAEDVSAARLADRARRGAHAGRDRHRLLWLFLLAAALTFHPPPCWVAGQAGRAGGRRAAPFPVRDRSARDEQPPCCSRHGWRGAERGSGIDVLGQRIFFWPDCSSRCAAALLPAAVAAARSSSSRGGF